MPTGLSLFFLVVAGSVVAAQGPFTTSLVIDPNALPTTFTTVRTTVTVTLTTSPPLTTTLSPVSTITTTLVVSTTSSPETTTTTIHSDPNSSSSHEPTNASDTPIPSGTLAPLPTDSNSALSHNPGALAGLIVGLCVIVTGLLVFAWFTIKRHRLKELENKALDPPPIGGMRHSMSAADMPPGHVHSRIIDDDLDLEIQSSVGHEMRSSSVGHGGIVSSLFGAVGPEESPEQRVDGGVGYLPVYTTATSSNGHCSSHGHGTVNTRNSSVTQIGATTRNPSPTLSRQNPRTRFSLGPPVPSAWNTSISEAPTRRASIDEVSTYNPHRVHSEPVALGDASLMSIYGRLSSEIPRPDAFPRPGILIHPASQNPPSSLLRPPSAPQIPTRQTLQSQPSGVYLGLPFVSEPIASSAASNVSFQSGREGLLGTPPNPTESLSSLRDEYDYSRRLGVVGSGLRDSTSMVEADSDSEVHPSRDSTHRRATLE